MTEIGFFKFCIFPLNVGQVVHEAVFSNIVSLKKEHIYNGISINTEMTNISNYYTKWILSIKIKGFL